MAHLHAIRTPIWLLARSHVRRVGAVALVSVYGCFEPPTRVSAETSETEAPSSGGSPASTSGSASNDAADASTVGPAGEASGSSDGPGEPSASATDTSDTAATTGGAECGAGFADCDGDPTNACETPTDDDPENCGGCEIVCDGECDSGECAALVVADELPGRPLELAIGPEYVYFANTGHGIDDCGETSIERVARDGTGGLELVLDDPGLVTAMQFIGGELYYTTRWNDFATEGTCSEGGVVGRVGESGEDPELLIGPAATSYGSLRVVGGSAWFTSCPWQLGEGGEVAALDLAPGAVAQSVYATNDFDCLWDLQVTDTDVFASRENEPVVRIALDGGDPPAPTIVAEQLAVDDSWLYYSQPGALGEIGRLPLAGGASESVSGLSSQAHLLVRHRDDVYWTQSSELRRVSAGGGKAAEVVLDSTVWDLKSADDGIYVIEEVAPGSSRILRLATLD